MTKPRTLTLTTLQRLGACRDQIDLFKCLFGASVVVTRELASKHAEAFLWNWASEHLLSEPAWRAFDEATAPARSAYNEATADAWRAFNEAISDALRAYVVARAGARIAYTEATAPARSAYVEASAIAFADAYNSDPEPVT